MISNSKRDHGCLGPEIGVRINGEGHKKALGVIEMFHRRKYAQVFT